MNKNSIVNLNGALVDSEKATISIFDRGFLFGDSIYEVTLTYNKKPFLMDEHLDRLFSSAEKIFMPLQFSKENIRKEVQKTIDFLNLDRIYIRIIITRGSGEIGLDPALATTQNLIIIAKELPEYPKSWYENGVHMIVADVLRNSKKSMDPNVKSGNYLNNVLAMAQAKEKGAYDAIMLNHKGYITEATTSNIWIIQSGKILTPPLSAGILDGITRRTLIEIATKAGFDVSEVNFTADTLKIADEVFFTSSTKEIVPITMIDDQAIGNGQVGPLTKALHKHYQDFVNANIN